jgi:hypothetical protein
MTTRIPIDAEFTRLRNLDLSEIRGEAWDTHFAALAQWLRHADPEVRKQALERLGMGVLWSERSSLRWGKEDGVVYTHDPLARLAWLIAAVEAAHDVHSDVIPAFLGDLRYKGDDEPYRSALVPWLERLRDAPPSGVDPGVAEGTLVLMRWIDDEDPACMASFVALLDHPHAYVRACAARKIGGIVGGPESAPLFALIADKERGRPGVAGPFWSDWHGMRENVPVDPVEWMMDMLERRKGAPPADLPFNDIAFYLHELCDHSPETVERMIRGGYLGLAVMTATETNGVVRGMEPVLRQLADRPEPDIAGPARFHLASHYRFLHPAVADGSIRRWPDWSPETDIFSFHWGERRTLWFAVIYPKIEGKCFDDASASAMIDRLLPPDLRGEPVRHSLDFPRGGEVRPFRLGDTVHHKFASGAWYELSGDPDAKAWARITIHGGQLRDRWTVFAS